MDEFIVIKVMNEAMLRLKKRKNEDYKKNEELKKYLEDEALFFRIKKAYVIEILNIVGVAEDKLEETYQKLTNKEMYDKLIKNGKINSSDDLAIKYE